MYIYTKFQVKELLLLALIIGACMCAPQENANETSTKPSSSSSEVCRFLNFTALMIGVIGIYVLIINYWLLLLRTTHIHYDVLVFAVIIIYNN